MKRTEALMMLGNAGLSGDLIVAGMEAYDQIDELWRPVREALDRAEAEQRDTDGI